MYSFQLIIMNSIVKYSKHDWTCSTSSSSSTSSMTGILFLHQSFGRYKTKCMYRCIPTDKNQPACLIPFQAPLGFFKKTVHKYILFHYVAIYSGINHCCGHLDSVIGNIDDLTSYYDYLLYSKHLFHNNNWSKQKFIPPISSSNFIPQYDIPFNTSTIDDVFTIDSKGTIDYDDALQYHLSEDGTTFHVSVYITCVADVLIKLFHGGGGGDGCGTSNWIYLLNHYTSNSSTLYLPHRRIPMLNDFISKLTTLSVCSSVEPRLCLVVRFIYDYHNLNFIHSYIELVYTRVRYNWNWNEGDLYISPLHDFTKRLIKDSTDVLIETNSKNTVAYWMIRYNQYITKYMQSLSAFAWYRSSSFKINNISTPELLHGENLYLNSTSIPFKFIFDQVCSSADSSENLSEDSSDDDNIQDTDIMIPMTNPMRRFVDLFNQYCLLFYKSISSDFKLIEYFKQLIPLINQNLKIISKIQRDCRLLNHFYNDSMNSRVYIGILFHKQFDVVKKTYLYSVFLQELGVYLSYKNAALLTEGEYSFRLFYFKDALQIKQKICVALQNDLATAPIYSI